jgi:hypothetical protein
MINLKDAGIDLGLAIAGLFGAILMSSKEAGQNPGKTIASLVGGAASANYVTPLILKVAHLDGEPQYSYAAAFLLGFCGLRAVENMAERILSTHGSTKPAHRPKRARK